MTYDNSSVSLDDQLTVSKTHKQKTVEGRLLSVTKALAATESNIYLFGTLKRLGLATNDVRNFVEKQTLSRRANFSTDSKVKRSAMQSKLTDACAYAKRLRQDKNTLKKRVISKYQNNVAMGRRVIDEIHKKYQYIKNCEMKSADKKIKFYREREKLTKTLIEAPDKNSF